MFLFDTNVISEFRKIEKGKANTGVIRWSENHDIRLAYISVITVMEIQQGILRLARKDEAQAQRLQQWRDKILNTFEGRIIPVTTEIALQCAGFHVPDKQPANDALIAATAKVKGLTVVTRNSKDFDFSGVKVFNPFD